MRKVEDYQVEAASKVWRDRFPNYNPNTVREMLEAALSATPPEPEIVVTEEMVNAGLQYADMSSGNLQNVYRAMHKVSPKGVPSLVSPAGGWLHCRKGEAQTVGDMRSHRRQGDKP